MPDRSKTVQLFLAALACGLALAACGGSLELKTDSTIGIDARTHRKTFEKHQAGFTPVVSDGRRLYLIGYYELIGLNPAKR